MISSELGIQALGINQRDYMLGRLWRRPETYLAALSIPKVMMASVSGSNLSTKIMSGATIS